MSREQRNGGNLRSITAFYARSMILGFMGATNHCSWNRKFNSRLLLVFCHHWLYWARVSFKFVGGSVVRHWTNVDEGSVRRMIFEVEPFPVPSYDTNIRLFAEADEVVI